MPRTCYPKNECIKNGAVTEFYLFCLRRKWRILSRLIGLMLGCEIRCEVPERLFLPHPNGIVTGGQVRLQNDVVLLQQVTLGCLSPYAGVLEHDGDPTVKEGVYVGPGAKILGPITIGEWCIVGANAVVTEDMPPYSMIVGYNKVLPTNTRELQLTAGLKRAESA